MSRKLLLADDSITIQKVVELVLSEEDFHIKAVSNGNDALSQVEVFNPDVVLADIEMPGMNGYQLCDKIKKNRATAHISVLLLAGAFEPLDEELAKNVGADDYIVKPFESQELISKINAVLTVSGTVSEAAVAEAPGEAEEVHQIAQETVAEVEALETVEVAESAGAAEEDLWAMDEAEPLESKTADVWEIDEDEAVSAESVDIGMAEMDMATGIEEVQAVEEVVALADEPVLAAAEPEPVIAEPSPIETVPYEGPVTGEPIATAPVETPVPVSTPEVKMPSSEEITKSVTESVQGQIRALVEQVDVKSIISETIKPLILESIEKSLHDVLPELLQSSLKEMVQGSVSSVNKQIENVIWETVPDLAENIIKKEIEKIKSES